MIRLRCIYYSDKNEKYHLEIHDTTLVSATYTDFDMPYGQAPIYSYDNDEVNIFSEIAAMNMTFMMFIENSDHETFYSDFVTSAEGRFYVKVVHLYNPTPETEVQVIKFVGKLTHDLALLQDTNEPTLSLSAIDGMMELDNIDFAGFNQYRALKKLFINDLLLKASINTYFFDSDTDHILSVYNQYASDEKAGPEDMFSYTFINDYFKKESNGVTKRPSCLEVLREILRSLGARMYFMDGVYVVEQISMRNNESPSYSKYLKDLSYDGYIDPSYTDIDYYTDGASYETQSVKILAHPNYTFIAPLRKAVLTQDGKLANNRIFDLIYTWYSTSGLTQIDTVSDLEDGLKIYCAFNLNPWVVKDANYLIGTPKNGYAIIEVQIRVGTKYLSGSGTIFYGSGEGTLTIDDATWSSTITERVKVIVPSFVLFNDLQPNAIDTNYDITIVSPELEATGDVYFNIEYDEIYADPNETAIDGSLSPYFNRWIVSGQNLTIVKNLNEEYNEGDTLYDLVNDLNNTTIYHTGYDMGDFPGVNTRKKLKIDFPTPGNDSDGWTSSDITSSTIYQLMALNDIVALRRIARKRLHTQIDLNTLNRPIRMMDRFVYKTDVFIPMTMTVNTGTDSMDVIWMAIAKDYSTMNTPDETTPTVRNGLSGGDYGGTNLQTGDDTNVQSFYIEGTMSGSTFDLSTYEAFPDTDVWTMASINHSMKVWIGSTLYHIVDEVVGSLENTECRLDFAAKEVQFSRALTGRLIRVEAVNKYELQAPSS